MRKLLLLTYHFPPSSAAAVHRMLGLVRYLPQYGWQPVVVAPPCLPWEPEDEGLLSQVPPGTPVERVPLTSGPLKRLIRYFARDVHWLVKALGPCRRMIREQRVEAILTSGPPHAIHLLGLWLNWRYRLPWIACFRDPWIVNHPAPGRALALARDRWLEKQVMTRATRLVANTPLNQEGWAAAYPKCVSKMVTITNGFEPDFRSLGDFGSLEARTAPPTPRDRLTILHAGELYAGRDPRPLLEALRQFDTGSGAEHLPVELELLGRMTDHALDFSAEIRRLGLEHRVRLTGQVPYTQALERMKQADILLILQMADLRLGVPGKLYEYLGIGRPILALAEPDSDIAWVLRESKILHRLAPAKDVGKIKQALTELTREVEAGRPAVPDPSAVRQFTRERMAQRVALCLDGCV